MGEPDIQYFAESGTWIKPPGAVRVDYLIRAGGGGGTVGIGEIGRAGEDGALHSGSFLPAELPEQVQVDIGRGGRGAEFRHVKAGDGAAGYALFVTWTEPQSVTGDDGSIRPPGNGATG